MSVKILIPSNIRPKQRKILQIFSSCFFSHYLAVTDKQAETFLFVCFCLKSTTFLINPHTHTLIVSQDFNYNIAFLNKALPLLLPFNIRLKTFSRQKWKQERRFSPILICDISYMNVHDWKKNKRIQKPWQKVIIFYDWRNCVWSEGDFTSGVQKEKKTYLLSLFFSLILWMRLFNVNTCSSAKKKELSHETRKMGRKFSLFMTFFNSFFYSLPYIHIIGNVFVVAIFYAWNLLRTLMLHLSWTNETN